jgi:hypothetical protein
VIVKLLDFVGVAVLAVSGREPIDFYSRVTQSRCE